MVSRRTVTGNIKAPWAASCKPSWEAAAPARFRVPGPAEARGEQMDYASFFSFTHIRGADRTPPDRRQTDASPQTP